MERPNVRFVQPQEEINNEVNINSWEAEQLLRKYGHNTEFSSFEQPQVQPIDNGMSFEEMIKQQDESDKMESNRLLQRQNSPKPITFNGDNGYNSETRYSSDEDTGFGFKIEVSTDMKLPKY